MSDDPTAVAAAWYETIEAAWNAADGAAFGAAFTEPCEMVDIRGVLHDEGPVNLGQGHQQIFDTIYRESVIRYRVEHARRLDDDTVIAHGTGSLDAPHAPPPIAGGAMARSTVVLLRDGATWRCTAMQNTLVMVPPAASGATSGTATT